MVIPMKPHRVLSNPTRSVRVLPLLLALPLALLAAPVADASAAGTDPDCASGPPFGLGQVTVLQQTCNPGPLPGTTCLRLLVQCAGIPDIEAELRITEPAPGVPLRGTVLFGTGGGGTDFYVDRPGGSELFQDLLARGFRIVDRRWQRGWFFDPFGVRRQSCRYATLLAWVRNNAHTSGAFVATGNSGGSGELSYALTTWGVDPLVDVAVPTGGPPMARLDYLCLNPPGWQDLCQSLVPPFVMTCGQSPCTPVPIHNHPVCFSCSSTPTLLSLEEDSVLHPGAILDYPATRVHLIIGSEDCSLIVPMAVLFRDAVNSEIVLEFAPGAPHFVPETPAGREAVLRAILGGAACAPGPASMTSGDWPTVGGVLELNLVGSPGEPFEVNHSRQSAIIERPGLGWSFLAPPTRKVASGFLDSAGRALVTVPIPPNPNLAGKDVYFQAQFNSCLSNLVHVQIQP